MAGGLSGSEGLLKARWRSSSSSQKKMKAPGRLSTRPLGDFFANFTPEPRATDFDALGLRSGHSGFVRSLIFWTFRPGGEQGGYGLSQATVSYASGHWDTPNTNPQ